MNVFGRRSHAHGCPSDVRVVCATIVIVTARRRQNYVWVSQHKETWATARIQTHYAEKTAQIIGTRRAGGLFFPFSRRNHRPKRTRAENDSQDHCEPESEDDDGDVEMEETGAAPCDGEDEGDESDDSDDSSESSDEE